MKYKKFIIIGVGIVAVLLAVFTIWKTGDKTSSAPPIDAMQKQFQAQSATEGSVTISATPMRIGDEWKIDLVFDTHSVELDQDLLANAALYDDASWEYRPVSWEGDQPGGHHRKGTLAFLGIRESTRTLTLVIKDIGGIPERIFNWTVTK